MKKIISAAAVIAAMGMLSISAFAETVNVTISDGEGTIVVANQPIETEDVDGDGSVTINDALYTTHELLFYGGAEAGYASGTSEYGIMLQKLWGVENGGNYGYYVNNSLAMSLGDKINDGDNISAYIYQDTATYSDVYCYFDTLTRNEVIGIEPDISNLIELTLYAVTFDADFNPVPAPLAGAVITLNGGRTDYVTDENGVATIEINDEGTYTISAVSDTQLLVPPILTLTTTADFTTEEVVVDDTADADVSLYDADADIGEAEPAGSDVEAAAESTKGSPDTGVSDIAAAAGIALLAVGGITIAAKKRK